MDKQSLEKLVGALGCAPYHRTGWVNCPCVFAPWQHESGKDSNPSAGFSIAPGGASWYHCWTCQEKKPVLEVVMKLRRLHRATPSPYSIDLKTAYALAMAEEILEQDDLDFSDTGDYEANKKAKVHSPDALYPFDEDWFASFTPWRMAPDCIDYLNHRAQPTTGELLDKYEVVWDNQRRRVCFPTRGFDGVLYGLHGRAVDEGNSLRYFAYGYKDKRNPQVWMGENLVDMDKPVVITEGMFDMVSIARVYPNVLASRSSEIHKDMWRRLEHASQIVTFYDYGVGGEVARKKVEHYFKDRAVYHLIPTKEQDDAGDMSESAIRELLEKVDLV